MLQLFSEHKQTASGWINDEKMDKNSTNTGSESNMGNARVINFIVFQIKLSFNINRK